jgi:hypothetical protein
LQQQKNDKKFQKVVTVSPEVYEYYMYRPVQFAQEQILRLEPHEVIADKVGRRLEPQTKEILQAVADHDYVSVFSGRGCTKTTALAMLAIWWVWRCRDSRVLATSPKYETLKATLWAEIRKWLIHSRLMDEIEWTSEKIYHVDPEMLSFGQPMTAKDKENISGFHATHVLYLIDEASNVARDIIDAIMGGMNDPENKIVMAGNPTLASGPFFDTHNKDRKFWYKLRFSSEHSERKNPVWFARMQRYPKNSDMYRVYVDGLPPLGNPKAIITLAECQAARDREVEAGDYLEMGVDPAREGDDMATIAIRQGMKLLEIRGYAKTKGPELEKLVLTMLREYRRRTKIKGKVRIKVDDHGIGGPVGDYLALNTADNIEVVPCLFNGAGDEQYYNSASRMWGNMADIIDRVELCDDDELLEELSTREWAPGSGKLKVEQKDVYKKRIGHSPDRADACIMCYYTGVQKVFEKADNKEGEEDPIATDFVIDWYSEHLMNPSFGGVFMIDVLHYAALVFNKDLSVDGLAAVYQHYTDKLWVYAEFHQAHLEPDIMAEMVKRMTYYGLYKDERNVRIFGNEDIFNRGRASNRQSLADVLLRSGLYIISPEKYDEYGAIALGIRMFKESKIRIHSSLVTTQRVIGLWSIKKGRPDAEDNGIGLAFLLILSEVRRMRKVRVEQPKLRDYTPVLKQFRKEKSSYGWCRK